MNDSFLEDLELVTIDQKAANTVRPANERNITRRRSQPSPVHPAIAEAKITHRRSAGSKETEKKIRKTSSSENRAENVKSRATESRSKPVENIDYLEVAKPGIDTKDRNRRPAGSNKESSRCSDGSSKDNSRPSDSSKESLNQAEIPKERSRSSSDVPNRRREAEEKFEVAMLNSVKDIVSIYTKNESAKILRAMQELFIVSQSNLLKLTIQQTDELLAEGIGMSDSPRIRSIVEENDRLKSNVAFLEASNLELRNTVEEIKKENLQLKNHNKLLKSGTAKENNRPPDLPKESASPKTRARQFKEICRNAK